MKMRTAIDVDWFGLCRDIQLCHDALSESPAVREAAVREIRRRNAEQDAIRRAISRLEVNGQEVQ